MHWHMRDLVQLHEAGWWILEHSVLLHRETSNDHDDTYILYIYHHHHGDKEDHDLMSEDLYSSGRSITSPGGSVSMLGYVLPDFKFVNFILQR
jgi:hypothetical protein